MANSRQKADIGMSVTVLLGVILITGVILHLKKHGVLIEPRSVIKMTHWICGFAMSVLAFIHWKQFDNMLSAMKSKFKWFYATTTLLKITLVLTLLTGVVKLFSPVRIPHLGLWHYGLGIAMSVLAVIHLFRGIPCWNRLRKKSA